MFESIVKFFKKIGKSEKESSKSTAKERLHLVLAQDRANISADFLEMMKQEIIEVIKKYIDIDEGAIDVRLTNKQGEDGTVGAPSLYANIPIVTIKNEARKLEGKVNTSSQEENKNEELKVQEQKNNENRKQQKDEQINEVQKQNTKKENAQSSKSEIKNSNAKLEKQETKPEKKEEKNKISESEIKTKIIEQSNQKNTENSNSNKNVIAEEPKTQNSNGKQANNMPKQKKH